MWFDVINNSVTSHPKHPKTPITAAHLLKELERIANLVAIVYVQRKTPTSTASDLFKNLLKFRIQVLHLTKDLLSRRKQNSPDYTKPYQKLYVRPFLEVKLLTTLRSYDYNIKKIVNKNERFSQSNRKKAAAEVTSNTRYSFLVNFASYVAV